MLWAPGVGVCDRSGAGAGGRALLLASEQADAERNGLESGVYSEPYTSSAGFFSYLLALALIFFNSLIQEGLGIFSLIPLYFFIYWIV